MTIEEIKDDIRDDICGLKMDIELNRCDMQNLEKELDKINKHGDWFGIRTGLQSSYRKIRRRQIQLKIMLLNAKRRLENLSA